jgi:hypothetical protein
MNANASVEGVLRQYLLGSIAPEVRESVERRLFSDDRIFWEQLCLVEDELIDDYVGERLDRRDAEDFERCFLVTAERREKLDFARAINAYVDTHQSRRASLRDPLHRRISAASWAAAMVATLVLVVSGLRWQLAPPTSEDEVSAWLSPGLVRGVGERVERVSIPAGCKLVRLHLEPDSSGFQSYHATLHLASGEEMWSQANLPAATISNRAAVTLTLPAEVLSTGDYYVRLRGTSPGQEVVLLDRYDFRVLRP